MIDGLIISAIGMAVVFAFLSLLVAAMALLNRLTAHARVADHRPSDIAERERLVAIAAAAIASARSRRPGGR